MNNDEQQKRHKENMRENMRWKMKTDRLGEWTPAVQRRHKEYEDKYITGHNVAAGALVNHESRSKFGYNYLKYVK